MMKNLFYITILFLLGCIAENFPPEPDVEYYTIIQNKSSHIINIERIWKGEIRSPYKLYPNQNKEFFIWLREEDLPYFPTLGDTTRIIFDEKILVLHTKQENQEVSRSIMLESSYRGGKINGKLYEIFYEFTDADYEEAVLINEGG